MNCYLKQISLIAQCGSGQEVENQLIFASSAHPRKVE